MVYVDWNDADKFGVARVLFGLLLAPIALVLLPRQGGLTRNYSKQTYNLPVCLVCKGQQIEIIESFPEGPKIWIAVSQDFAARFHAGN